MFGSFEVIHASVISMKFGGNWIGTHLSLIAQPLLHPLLIGGRWKFALLLLCPACLGSLLCDFTATSL